MVYLIKAIGLIFVICGVYFTVLPSSIKTFISFAKEGKRVYIGCAIRIVLGILLLIASPHASFFWIPLITSILLIVWGSVPIFIGIKNVYAILSWCEARADTVCRALSIAFAILGILIIYSA